MSVAPIASTCLMASWMSLGPDYAVDQVVDPEPPLHPARERL